MPYNKKKWIDHITDQTGEIIQQGTPLSSSNLNNIENGIANAHIGIDNNVEAIREAICSGFTKLGDIDYSYMSTTPNTIRLSTESIAFVNGYKVVIPAGTVITLDAPPTEEKREDLAFLEVWKAQATDTKGEEITWRLRTVAGVNFKLKEEGIDDSIVKAFGGNLEDTSYNFVKQTNDVGLYKTGNGSNTILALKTADGYSYAIPMFRVWRRNSERYSDNNGNGALLKTSGTSDRPDSLFADIIAERDIIDLRHQVSLTGFNYQQLLEENFDKLLKGELQTKERTKMLKTYHGIPKTPIDSNTVFYASFDGTTVAEKGGAPSVNSASKFYQSCTGLGAVLNLWNKYTQNIALSDAFTLDFSIDTKYCTYLADARMIGVYSGASKILVMSSNSGNDSISITSIGNEQIVLTGTQHILTQPGTHHIRVSIKGLLIKVFIDGKNKYTGNLVTPLSTCMLTDILIGNNDGGGNSTNSCHFLFSDFSISNIDRGDVFPTLPKDFIDGYAKIMPAFNEQRQIQSDTFTAEYKCEVLKATGSNRRHITTTQASPGIWASGDTLKVKGLGGEIITGCFDSDTALAKIINIVDNSSVAYVDDVSKISIGDSVNLMLSNGEIGWTAKTITAIDTTNKSVTFDSPLTNGSILKYGYLLETTVSASSPVIGLNGTTAVVGTWSGLGTNEATFTFGTNASLTNQDVTIEYSLNEVAGQGGTQEVLTKTLAGEYNGKKLIVNPTVHIIDDFKGKIAGSTVENPNIFKFTETNVLLDPKFFNWEANDDQCYPIKFVDANCRATSTTTNGNIPQQLFSFNIIEIFERKFGKIPADTISGKVAWIKNNASQIGITWYGKGICSVGAKAIVAIFSPANSSWTDYSKANSSADVTKLYFSIWDISTLNKYIDNEGKIHTLAYTDASDGVTPSTIHTDYVKIELTLKTPAGYDVLAPENPRRDDGLSNILLIRKETKEIRVMFSGVDNNKGVITYGDYVPYQGMPYAIDKPVFALDEYFITSSGTGSVFSPVNAYFSTKVLSALMGYTDTYKLTNDNVLIPSAGTSTYVRLKTGGVAQNKDGMFLVGSFAMGRRIIDSTILAKNVNFLVIECVLIKVLNKLQLFIIGNTAFVNSEGKLEFIANNNPMCNFELINRPIIK